MKERASLAPNSASGGRQKFPSNFPRFFFLRTPVFVPPFFLCSTPMLVEVFACVLFVNTLCHSSPLLGSWARDGKRACVKSVVGRRPLTGTLAVRLAGRASAVGYLACQEIFSTGRFALKAALAKQYKRINAFQIRDHVCIAMCTPSPRMVHINMSAED